AGESGHGGSTITQQVVRNINMRFERSLARKVQEWYNALDLERRYSKWQILEMYMNIIYMGNGCYGVQSASMKYFGKEVSELSLAQCAYLAGITNSPGLNNPLSEQGNENAIERQHLVLAKMLDLKSISQKEHDDALIEELKIINKDESAGSIPIQTYFVDYVVDEVINDLIEVRGMSRELAAMSVYNFGYKIYTTQDTSVQNVLDEVFQNDKYFYMENKAAKKVGNEHSQAAMIIMDPYTGQIKGMYGGYGKKEASRTLNRATQSKRQPGSSIKPIAVYAPALDLRIITPATIIDDVTAYMKTTGEDIDMPYPINFDQKNWGLTSIRDAIRRSVNVIAATVWRDHLGPDKSIEYLKRVGIDREKERYVSLALGGLNVGVNPLIMSSAFVPFVNKGIYYKPVGYTKVEDSNGNILLEKKPNYSAAYDETTAFLMLDMLQEVTRPGGTAPTCVIKNAKGESIITGGKTGTTSLNIDKWFVGFTPYYVAATWYGYDNKIKKIEIEKAERNNAQIIWQAVMEKIHQNLAPKEFTPPNGLVKRSICIYSGKIATDICAQDPRGSAVREEYFIKGTEPGYSDLCTVHIKALVCTAAKDTWGRNLLVGPYCPVETVIEKVFIRRPVPYVPVKPDDKYPEDWIYEITDGEYCNIHGEPLLPSPESTPEVTGALPDETPPTTDETTLTPTP
ncbi:MAG: transglycosylase domain-containing protein, partial [Clostridiales bacterium]|nr:transglycosylase domain-containing protein [Clostridiales bacterium]